MLYQKLLDRFAETTPLTVMTRALLENALQPKLLDELFARLAQRQYHRELLFSTVVNTMTLVACRIYKSPHAVYVENTKEFPVTLKCFYEKLQGIELPLLRELVCDNARRLTPIIEQLQGRVPDLLPGYRVKIIDGNALAGTDHRIEVLRQTKSAALPGKSLVVLDPALGLVLDVIPCEDGHAQERSLFDQVLPTVQAKDLWIEDRNFCTLGFIFGILQRAGSILVREHKGLPWKPLSCLKRVGTIASGSVLAQEIEVEHEGQKRTLRRIVIRLNEPTRDGETQVVVLTNLRRVSALKLAQLYLERWQIESAFNLLTTTLKCEQSSLGYPKAALLGFCVTLLAYNVLATVKAALRSVHGNEKMAEVSQIKLTEHVNRHYAGMVAGLTDSEWLVYSKMTAQEMASFLREMATNVCLEKIRKAKTRPRKNRHRKVLDPAATPHVSTARLLAAQKKEKLANANGN